MARDEDNVAPGASQRGKFDAATASARPTVRQGGQDTRAPHGRDAHATDARDARATGARPKRRRRWPWVLGGIGLLLAAFVVCVGPWPTYDDGYEGTAYAEATFARIDAWDADAAPGALQAGVAAVEITPSAGEPLAGYSAREPKACSGADEALHAKAITLANGRATVTILGGDILLVLPALRDAILDRLDLPREQVYFTATHTHAGPGGFSGRWVDEIVLGDHDPAVADRLADRFAEAVRRSRADLRPATMELHTLRPTPDRAASYIRNRLPGDGAAHGTVHVLLWRRAGRDEPAGAPGEPAGVPLAALVVASPHPTCLGHENRRASADYPGVVQRRLAAAWGCPVLFAAGAVGSMGPAEVEPRGPERMQAVGEAIVAGVQTGTDAGSGGAESRPLPARRAARIESHVVPVNLPPLQYRLSDDWRLSPIAARYLHGRRTYVHVLRIGEAVLLGMPCDYSGELAVALEAWAVEHTALTPVVTSFNGDYIGYVLPPQRYRLDHYEAWDLNVFGPACGAYLDAVARRVLRRWAAPEAAAASLGAQAAAGAQAAGPQ